MHLLAASFEGGSSRHTISRHARAWVEHSDNGGPGRARAIVKVLVEDQAAPATYYSFPAENHSSDSRLTLFSFVRTLVDDPVRSIAFFDSRSGDVSIAINGKPPRYEVSAATAKRFVAVLEMFSRAEPAHHEHPWGTSYAFPGICKRTARLLPQRETILADVVAFVPDAVGQPAA